MAHQAHDIDAKQRTLDVQLIRDFDFASMYLPDNILKGLKDCGFRKPSPIQLKAIPLARCGFDLIVHAKSGTGKTLVFSLLVLEFVKVSVKRVQSVIITPTREIALQISDVIKGVGVHIKGLRVGTFIGGTPVGEDQKMVVGCQVAVGCPGRLKHLLELGALDPRAVKVLVLDEADQLMDQTFLKDVEFIASSVGKSRQVLACSATLIPKLETFMGEDVGVVTPETPQGGPQGMLLGLRHFVTLLPHHPDPLARILNKQQALLQILSTVPFDQALVFSNYHSRAESICGILNKKGWAGTWLAGKQEMGTRTEAVGRLRGREVRVLVATDLAARGLDCQGVNLVVGMDVPHDPRTYLHRAGRAGRYGSHGLVISIVTHGAEEEAFRKTLGRIGGAAMRVGVINKVNHGELWTVEDRELEQLHGIPPAEESEDSGRESEAEADVAAEEEGSEAEADRAESRPRRKRKKERRPTTSLKTRMRTPQRLGSNKKVKFANDGNSANNCGKYQNFSCLGEPSPSGKRNENNTVIKDLVAGFSRMSTGEGRGKDDCPSREGREDGTWGRSRNKRKLSGGGSDSEGSTSSCTSSCSEGEYVLSEPPSRPHSHPLPPIDQEHFRNWYSLWHNQNLELKRYIDYCRYFNPN